MLEADLYMLLMMLRNGGSIVSSSECSPQEIAMARVEARIFVDKDGFGYVYQPKQK